MRHSDDGNPFKTLCSGAHPQYFFETVSNFWGAPIGDRLVGFDNKVAPVGAPKEKRNLAFATP